MHLVPPQGRKRKWDVRFTNHDGRVVRVPGDRDESVANRIGGRIDALVRAKQHGELPPGDLAQWIDSMPESLRERLVSLGLLDARRFERLKPLEDHIVEFGRTVAARKSNGARYAKQCEAKVRRVFKDMKLGHVADLKPTKFMEHLKAQAIATSTRRAYIVTLKDFYDEMKEVGAVHENPLANVSAPGAYENPEYERQPLTVAQFQLLMQHLDTFVRYKHQNARWTAHDRKMIYWTAVKTGFRQSEIRSLTKANFHLDEQPAVIAIKARHSKNKTAGCVPIPNDLAAALRAYIAKLEPNDKVFPFPKTCGSIVDMLRKDLMGVGIDWKLTTGEVIDFHTLRSTAITWWLTVDGLTQKQVQVLARLKTLAMVQNYSRNFKISDFTWLNASPTLVATTQQQKTG